ncbi:MAG TPA: hypothetical protein VHL09_04005 [Dehalococcoidia bacterium]|nr:hypothetical protein [Dehalococcoidia bacterium]
MLMLTREQLRTLIDTLPDDALSAAAQAIEQSTDPVLRALLLAPEDDEPETEEEPVAVAEANAQIASGELIDDDDFWAGLDQSDAR